MKPKPSLVVALRTLGRLQAAPSIFFLTVCFVSDGSAFNRALGEVRSQCSSEPICMICTCKLLLPDH